MKIHSIDNRKLVFLIRYVSLTIVVSVLLSILTQLLASLMGASHLQNALEKVKVLEPGTWALLAMSCVFEEILFRGALSLGRKAMTISIFFMLLVGLFYISKIATPMIHYSRYGMQVTFIICVAASALITYLVNMYLVEHIKTFLLKNYNIFFWLSCLLFAIAHILNCTNKKYIFLIYILLVVPQLVMGVILGIVRIRFGIGWSILVHFLVDSWLFLCIMVGYMRNEHIVAILCGFGLSLVFLYGLVQLRLIGTIVNSVRNPSHLLLCAPRRNFLV